MLKTQSKSNTEKIVTYVGNDAERFKELVNVFVTGPYRVTQRAAWPLSCCVRDHPALVNQQLRKIIDFANKTGVHDAVKRNVVRLLQFVSIPKSLQGKAADLCVGFLADPKQPIAVRVFSMTVLANLAKANPELKNEIIPLIENQLPFGSAGFRSRGIKVLRLLQQVETC